MTLSKSYLFKKSKKAIKLSPLHFHLSVFVNKKRLPDLASR
jgi:hypothetical protein